MPRSRINVNFIDKTSSIVANILLRIIPTTSGEKKAFTYYRDGAIFFFFLLFLDFSIMRKICDSGQKEPNYGNKPTLGEGEFEDRTIPSVGKRLVFCHNLYHGSFEDLYYAYGSPDDIETWKTFLFHYQLNLTNEK